MYSIDQEMTTIWPLLIRARQQSELDAAVASIVAHGVARVAPAAFAIRVSAVAVRAAVESARQPAAPAAPESRLAALDLIADWDDDICPPWRPHHPHLTEFGEIGDPLVATVLGRALALLEVASPVVRESLGAALTARGGIGETEQRGEAAA